MDLVHSIAVESPREDSPKDDETISLACTPDRRFFDLFCISGPIDERADECRGFISDEQASCGCVLPLPQGFEQFDRGYRLLDPISNIV